LHTDLDSNWPNVSFSSHILLFKRFYNLLVFLLNKLLFRYTLLPLLLSLLGNNLVFKQQWGAGKIETIAAKSSIRTESVQGTINTLSDVLRSNLCLSGQTMLNVHVYVENQYLLVIVDHWKATFRAAPYL